MSIIISYFKQKVNVIPLFIRRINNSMSIGETKYSKRYNFSWPKSEIIKSCLAAKYHRGVDQHGIQWPVDEAPVPTTSWSKALSKVTQTPLNQMKFSKVHSGGLPIHRDHSKLCSLNFPLVGDFNNSSIIFVDDFNEPLEEISCEEIYLINTRQLHGVKNETEKERITLTIGFDSPYKIIKERLHTI
jgi:hypothetical protein